MTILHSRSLYKGAVSDLSECGNGPKSSSKRELNGLRRHPRLRANGGNCCTSATEGKANSTRKLAKQHPGNVTAASAPAKPTSTHTQEQRNVDLARTDESTQSPVQVQPSRHPTPVPQFPMGRNQPGTDDGQ